MTSAFDKASEARRTFRQRAKPAEEPPTEKPDVAVITMTRDEGHMLKRWVRYYSKAVGLSNLIVFDDNSVDGSTKDLGCTVHRLPKFPGGGSFLRSRMRLANGIANGLLAAYDWVIFADVDEFLIPDPAKYDGLVDFLAARRDREVVAAMALNVVHHPDEAAIDPERPILDQRSFAKFAPRMCKPSIKRIPAQWKRSTHAIAAPFQVDPELFMMHMKFHDQDELRDLGDRRRALFEADRRGFKSSWKLTGRRISNRVGGALAEQALGDVPEFVPDPRQLEQVVQPVPDDGSHEAIGDPQLKAMVDQPLVRIPERLRGLV